MRERSDLTSDAGSILQYAMADNRVQRYKKYLNFTKYSLKIYARLHMFIFFCNFARRNESSLL